MEQTKSEGKSEVENEKQEKEESKSSWIQF
jgi:hypothetical protein